MYLDTVKADLPIGLWGMESAKDLSGFGNDLTLTNVTANRLPLVPDGGFSTGFAAASTAVVPLNIYSVDRPSSVEFWIKLNRQAGALLSRGTDGIFVDTNGFIIARGSEQHFVNIAQWVQRMHVVVTVSDHVLVYIDGQQVYSETSTESFTNTGNLVLGGAVFDIDALAIYNRVIAQDVVAKHYAAGQDFELTSNVAHIFGGECVTFTDDNAILADQFSFSTDWSAGDGQNVNTEGALSIDSPPDLAVIGSPVYTQSRNLLPQIDSLLTDFGGWTSTHELELEDNGLYGSNVLHVYPDTTTTSVVNSFVSPTDAYVSVYVQIIAGSIDDLSWDSDYATLVEDHGDWYRLITQSNRVGLLVANGQTEFYMTAPQVELNGYTAFTAGGNTAAITTAVLS